MCFPKLQIFVEMFRRNFQSPILKRHVGVPPWYKNHEISIYFSTNLIVALRTHHHNPEFQNALVYKRSMLLTCKVVNRYPHAHPSRVTLTRFAQSFSPFPPLQRRPHRLINMSPLIPDEDENFGGSLVLDFRK